MVSGIRSETNVSTSLANVYVWLAQNRGGNVYVSGALLALPGRDMHLRVGLPITAARAVICPVWLVEKQGGTTPLLAGRLSGLMNPRDGSVRLTFEGSAGPGIAANAALSTGENGRSEGARLARHLLALITVACQHAGEERLTA